MASYEWQGAGSTHPRNRHQSPAFGSPWSTPSKFKLSVVCGGCTWIVKKADAADMLDAADAMDAVDG